MIKAAIYSPYLDMLGGGEKYIFSIADALSRRSDVTIYADSDIRRDALTRFGLGLEKINLLPAKTLLGKNMLERYRHLTHYDMFFYMTDGSVFFSGAGKNFLIIQSPLQIPRLNLINRLKLRNWRILCYSRFMEDIIRKRMFQSAAIFSLPPCIVIPEDNSNLKKENIILTVGRFFPYPHDKKHVFMLDTFLQNYKDKFPGWKLIIAGGCTEEGGRKILLTLKEKSKGKPVEVLSNLSREKLAQLYCRAKIYWHAAGYGEDLDLYPEKAEHFGIAPLEAMAAGGVPLLFNAGGLRDITHGDTDFLWTSKEELADKTYDLIKNDKLLTRLSKKAFVTAGEFSCSRFYARIEKIIAG